ncbi:hypothetical protein [Lysinibacillus sphaericus]|uniref:Uncharacterized protein n=1 Tax=Lysinibacillus sphaericus (strain C3-41) TaxID=444177 RepID=B1I0K8_LYSSC|nr:hypothetical protein [Lysinibacillus sphaericus]MBE5085786.1 hypothetical protein [Bacillus thuringiensis]ACA42367.1 hypothetical protein Bsph_p137 [Lysinibacillus sphaericus C3-41]AMO35349.1 hypothetical protein AR327_22940 [Lysinibacillus sphaericus]AMR93048.1 hypothetical protein A1T07_22845 [Lysinibacillus sphaericus]MBG9710610.1 hypothetical protein [Lysinibacillus sphaericus]
MQTNTDNHVTIIEDIIKKIENYKNASDTLATALYQLAALKSPEYFKVSDFVQRLETCCLTYDEHRIINELSSYLEDFSMSLKQIEKNK